MFHIVSKRKVWTGRISDDELFYDVVTVTVNSNFLQIKYSVLILACMEIIKIKLKGTLKGSKKDFEQ
jgi:hypothetical protein